MVCYIKSNWQLLENLVAQYLAADVAAADVAVGVADAAAASVDVADGVDVGVVHP